MNHKMRFFRAAACLCIATVSGCAVKPDQSAPEASAPAIVWAGVFKITGTQTAFHYPNPSSVTGYRNGAGTFGKGERTLGEGEATSKIVAKQGTTFGIYYAWPRSLEFGPPHTVVWHFPKPGLLNPTTGKLFTEVRGPQQSGICSGGYRCTAAYTIDESWEAMLGPWIVEIHTVGAPTIAHTFTLIPE